MAQRSISTTFSLREGVTGRLADDWDDLFAGGNTYSTERDVASDDDGEREERRRAALRHLRRGLGAWLETPRYRAQLRRCPRDAGSAPWRPAPPTCA